MVWRARGPWVVRHPTPHLLIWNLRRVVQTLAHGRAPAFAIKRDATLHAPGLLGNATGPGALPVSRRFYFPGRDHARTHFGISRQTQNRRRGGPRLPLGFYRLQARVEILWRGKRVDASVFVDADGEPQRMLLYSSIACLCASMTSGTRAPGVGGGLLNV